jgi:hypothetical protein
MRHITERNSLIVVYAVRRWPKRRYAAHDWREQFNEVVYAFRRWPKRRYAAHYWTEQFNEVTNVNETILIQFESGKSELVQWQTDWTAGRVTEYCV